MKRSRAKCNWQRRRGLTHHQCRHDPVGRWSQKPLKDHQGRPARPGRPHHRPTPNRGGPIEIAIGNRCVPLLLDARLFTSLRSKSRRFPKKQPATKAAAIATRRRRSTRIANPFLEPRVKGARTRTTGVEIRGKGGGTVYPTRNIGQIPPSRAPTPTPPPPLLPRLRERKRIARARVISLCSSVRPRKNARPTERPSLARDRR